MLWCVQQEPLLEPFDDVSSEEELKVSVCCRPYLGRLFLLRLVFVVPMYDVFQFLVVLVDSSR